MLDTKYRTALGFLELLRKDWFGEGFGWKLATTMDKQGTGTTTEPAIPHPALAALRTRSWSLAPRTSFGGKMKSHISINLNNNDTTVTTNNNNDNSEAAADTEHKKEKSPYGTCAWPGLLLLVHCVNTLLDKFPDSFQFSKSFLTTLLNVFGSVNVSSIYTKSHTQEHISWV